MLLPVLCLSLFLCGALSQKEPGNPLESSNGTYEYILASPEDFAPTRDLLEVQPQLEETALQERQTFRCVPRSWVQCPNAPGRCKPPAASCCDSNYFYYPQRQTCCPGRGACRKTMKCCPQSCCPMEGRCGSDGYCSTLGLTTRTSTRTRTSTSTRSSTRTTASTAETTGPSRTTQTSIAYSTGPCKTPSPRPPQNIKLEERQYPREDFCTRICHIASGKEMMVLNLKNIPGVTDQLIDSTCRGMRARQQAGQIAKGLNPWEDILEYNGGGKSNRVTNVRCKEFCAEANRAATPKGNQKWAFECDEYPPASFNQRANAQTRLCIGSEQNSGTQAPILSDLVKHCKPKKGDKLLVRVDGGCPPARIKRDEIQGPEHALLPRQEDTTTIEISDSNSTLRNPHDDGSLTYVAMSLGPLPDGRYNLDINLSERVDNVTVMDSDGESYASTESPTGNVQLSFDVTSGDDYIPFALIAYTEKAVNVSYTGNGTTIPSDPEPEPSSGARTVQTWYQVMFLVAVTLVVFV